MFGRPTAGAPLTAATGRGGGRRGRGRKRADRDSDQDNRPGSRSRLNFYLDSIILTDRRRNPVTYPTCRPGTTRVPQFKMISRLVFYPLLNRSTAVVRAVIFSRYKCPPLYTSSHKHISLDSPTLLTRPSGVSPYVPRRRYCSADPRPNRNRSCRTRRTPSPSPSATRQFQCRFRDFGLPTCLTAV